MTQKNQEPDGATLLWQALTFRGSPYDIVLAWVIMLGSAFGFVLTIRGFLG